MRGGPTVAAHPSVVPPRHFGIRRRHGFHVTALAASRLHQSQLLRDCACKSRRRPVAEVVDAGEMVFVSDRLAGERAMTRTTERCRSERIEAESLPVGIDLAGLRWIGNGNGCAGEAEARVAIGPGRLDAVADEASDARIGKVVFRCHVSVDVARHQQQRVVATRTEAARFLASALAKLVDARAVPGIVERSVGVGAVHPVRCDVGVTIAAVTRLREPRQVERRRLE